MTIAERRAGLACLPPITLDQVVDDPEAMRALARRSGPYEFPPRPGGFVWPTWHARWASGGALHLDAAEPLFNHPAFIAAAADMCGSNNVIPEALNVNLGTPWIAQPVMHTDMPLFRGIDEETVPGWFLQSMGTSRLFEAERINSITAVAWFYEGEHGGFTFWPDGPAGESQGQIDMWNTAIVGDNDFMYHRVERIGPDAATSPSAMTTATVLDHDGDDWVVIDDGRELGRFVDRDVRLSISWRATVNDDDDASVSLAAVYDRMRTHLADGDLIATSVDDLFDEPSRQQLMHRWPGFLPVST